MWCFAKNKNKLPRFMSSFRPLGQWMRIVKSIGIPSWKCFEKVPHPLRMQSLFSACKSGIVPRRRWALIPTFTPFVKNGNLRSSSFAAFKARSANPNDGIFFAPGIRGRLLTSFRSDQSELFETVPSTRRYFSRKPLTPVEKYFRRRTREKKRQLAAAKASGKKPKYKVPSGMKKYKKQRKYYIMELLRQQMLQEQRQKEVAPQLPILVPYRPYEMIPRPEKVRKRQRLTLRQKVHNQLYALQQDRLAQKNPLHSQCRTCPVCQRRFIEGHQRMLHHLFHFPPCARTLPVETLNALIAQKEFAHRYEQELRPIKFKTKKQFR